MPRSISVVLVLSGAMMIAMLTGCSTAPKTEDQAKFLDRAETQTNWFVQNVSGLQNQIDHAEAYIIFPDVGQWGLIFGGGRYGRGALMQPGRGHTGWGAMNTASIGLQVGAQGFSMLIVLQDRRTLEEFKADKWTGSVTAVAIGGDAGGAASASFTRGLAIYKGANTASWWASTSGSITSDSSRSTYRRWV